MELPTVHKNEHASTNPSASNSVFGKPSSKLRQSHSWMPIHTQLSGATPSPAILSIGWSLFCMVAGTWIQFDITTPPLADSRGTSGKTRDQVFQRLLAAAANDVR